MRVKNRQLTTNEQHLIDLDLIFFLKIYKFCDCDDYLLDLLRTVSHAFGLVARYALIATLERRAENGSFGVSVFLKEKFSIFLSKTRAPQRNRFLHASRA